MATPDPVETVFEQSLTDMVAKDVPFYLRGMVKPHVVAIVHRLEADLNKAGWKVVPIKPVLTPADGGDRTQPVP